MTPRRAFLAAVAFLAGAALAAPLYAAAPSLAPTPRAKPPMPAPTAADLVANSGLTGVVAFILVDLETGAILDAERADLPLPPASVAKAPTALYALDALGPDYRFETRVAAVGGRSGGVLNGDLILQGGGDPVLDTADLNDLVAQVAARGITSVDGRFIVDAALLPSILQIDDFQPPHVQFNPSIGGLNLNFNRIFGSWRRRGVGFATTMEARSDQLSPPTSQARLEVAGETKASVFDYAVENGAGGEVEVWRVARRALRRDGSRWFPTRRPADYAARTFRDLARRAGVALPAHEAGAAPVVAEVLARFQSAPLTEIVRGMLLHSTNLTAETLGLAATRAFGGAAFGLEDSAGAMNAWGAGFAGFPAGDAGLQLNNHSGLSGESRASVRRIVELLVAAEGRVFPGDFAGAAVTLKDLLPEKPYFDPQALAPGRSARVFAKTGTLDYVTALAGYLDVETASPTGQRRFAFAYIAADAERRRRLNDPKKEITEGARAFRNRAVRLKRAMLHNWVNRFGG